MVMKRLLASLLAIGLLCAFCGAAQAGLVSADIGTPSAAGSWEEVEGVHTVMGDGNDIWGNSDNFHFVYQEMIGDVTIIARLTDLTYANEWTKGGVMIRDTLDGDSAFLFAFERTGNDDGTLGDGVFFQRRESAGAGAGEYWNSYSSLGFPTWLKLDRVGDQFTAYYAVAEDPDEWLQMGTTSHEVSMSDSVFVGMAVTSHADGTLSTGVFDNLSFTGYVVEPPRSTMTLDVMSIPLVSSVRQTIWHNTDYWDCDNEEVEDDWPTAQDIAVIGEGAADTFVQVLIQEGLEDPDPMDAFASSLIMPGTTANAYTILVVSAGSSLTVSTSIDAAAAGNYISVGEGATLSTGAGSSQIATLDFTGSATLITPGSLAITVGMSDITLDPEEDPVAVIAKQGSGTLTIDSGAAGYSIQMDMSRTAPFPPVGPLRWGTPGLRVRAAAGSPSQVAPSMPSKSTLPNG
jgi:hypothetical protein